MMSFVDLVLFQSSSLLTDVGDIFWGQDGCSELLKQFYTTILVLNCDKNAAPANFEVFVNFHADKQQLKLTIGLHVLRNM